MNDWGVVAVLGVAIFGVRALGFFVPVERLPSLIGQGLAALPVAMLAALLVLSPAGPTSGDPARIAGLGAGAVIAWRGGAVWIVLPAGIGLFMLLRAFGVGGG